MENRYKVVIKAIKKDLEIGDTVISSFSWHLITTQNIKKYSEDSIWINSEIWLIGDKEEYKCSPLMFKMIFDKLWWCKVTRTELYIKREEFDLEKICRDDSSAPYDSYCSYCSASSSCNSEEIQAFPLRRIARSKNDKWGLSINLINKEIKWEDLRTEFKRICDEDELDEAFDWLKEQILTN